MRLLPAHQLLLHGCEHAGPANAGPPPMMNAISGDKAKDKSQGELTGILKQLGYAPEQVFKF